MERDSKWPTVLLEKERKSAVEVLKMRVVYMYDQKWHKLSLFDSDIPKYYCSTRFCTNRGRPEAATHSVYHCCCFTVRWPKFYSMLYKQNDFVYINCCKFCGLRWTNVRVSRAQATRTQFTRTHVHCTVYIRVTENLQHTNAWQINILFL